MTPSASWIFGSAGSFGRAAAIGLVALISAASSARAAPPEAFRDLPVDPAGTNNNTHYLISNEKRPDLFWRHAQGRGGLYLGVGAEQNYVLAGWARPELMVLMDFDPIIVRLHTVHLALLRRSADAEAFIAAWDGSADAIRAALSHVPVATRTDALAVWESAHKDVVARLRAWRDTPPGGRATFLSDPEQYAAIRALALADRIITTQGDLTGQNTMLAIAAAARQQRLTVGVLYLSNAEQYFMYSAQFRKNIQALPFDDRTRILRTLPGRPRGFEYIVQQGLDFQARLHDRKVNSVYRIRGLTRGQHLRGETFWEVRPLKAGARPRSSSPRR